MNFEKKSNASSCKDLTVGKVVNAFILKKETVLLVFSISKILKGVCQRCQKHGFFFEQKFLTEIIRQFYSIPHENSRIHVKINSSEFSP